MKNKVLFTIIFTGICMAFTGCSGAQENLNTGVQNPTSDYTAKINDVVYNEPITEAAVIQNNNAEDIAVAPAETQAAEVPAQTEAPAVQTTEASKTEVPVEKPYPYPDDIKDDSVVLTVKEDGSIRAVFGDGAVELTFPADFSGNMIIENNVVYSKIAYENFQGAGEIMRFMTDDKLTGLYGASRPVAWGKGQYWYWYRPSDCKCNNENAGEYEQYSKMYNAIDEYVQNTFYGFSETGEKTKSMPLPLGFYGEINKTYSSTKGVMAYTSDYVLNNGECVRQWETEEGWHVTAVSVAFSHGKMWFDCYDTDDNDHYGWIDAEEILFYVTDATKDVYVHKFETNEND